MHTLHLAKEKRSELVKNALVTTTMTMKTDASSESSTSSDSFLDDGQLESNSSTRDLGSALNLNEKDQSEEESTSQNALSNVTHLVLNNPTESMTWNVEL